MAERYAVATGNWSDTSIWDGAALPGTTDDVHANGYTVTIDQDVETLSIKTTTGSSSTGARQFTSANIEYFDLGDNSLFEVGDNDAWWAGWVRFDDLITARAMFGKYNATAGDYREWLLLFSASTNRLQFNVSSDGTSGAGFTSVTFGSSMPLTATWYFVIAYHDAVNNEIGISVNGSSFATAAHDGGIYIGSAKATVGAYEGTPSYQARMDGRLARLAMGKSPSGGIAALTTTIRDSLFNNWRGKLYSDLTPSEITDWGLVWYADGTESSGNLIDQHGAVNGTDTNTVTAARGPNVPEAGGTFTVSGTRTITADITAGAQNCISPTHDTTIIGTVRGSDTGSFSGVSAASATGVTIQGDVYGGAAGRGLQFGAGSVSIIGNLHGGQGPGSAAVYGCLVSSTGTLTITGNVYAGNNISSGAGLHTSGAATINITGNVYGNDPPTHNNAHGINNAGSATISITGNIYGKYSDGIINSSAGIINVSGDVFGGTGGIVGDGISNTSSGTVNITGTVTGGDGASLYGVYNTSTGTINITGDVIAGTGTGANNLSTGNIFISGNITSSSSASGVLNEGSGVISIAGNMISDASGTNPYAKGILLIGDGYSQQKTLKTDNGSFVAENTRTFSTYEKYAVATGNWSDSATWDGGYIPTPNDYVFANGYVVTINQDVEAIAIKTSAGVVASAGGSFTLNGGYTLTSDVVAGTTTCVDYSSSTASNIIGNITAGSANPSRGVYRTGTGTLTITGNVNGGNNNEAQGLLNTGGGTITINGNIIAGPQTSGYGMQTQSATVNITGTVYGHVSVDAGRGLYVVSGTVNIDGPVIGRTGPACMGIGGTINVTGDVTGASQEGIYVAGSTVNVTGNITGGGAQGGIEITSGTLVVNGNVSGGNVGNGRGIIRSGTSTVTVNGNVVGGSGSAEYTFYNTAGGSFTINGDVTGGSGSNARGVFINSSCTANINGNITGGSATTASGVYAGSSDSQAIDIYVTGDILAGTHVSAYGIYFYPNNTNGHIEVLGNVTGSTTSGVFLRANSQGNIFTGNVTGGSANNAAGIWHNADGSTNATIYVTGDVTGGSSGGASGIYNRSNGTVVVTGNVYGSTGVGITNNGLGSGGGTTTVYGDAIAGSKPAISNNGSALVTVTGNLISSSSGVTPISSGEYGVSSKFLINSSNSQTLKMRRNESGTVGAERTLYTHNAYGGGI